MDKVKFNTHNLDESEIFLLVPTYFYKYASINRDLEENLEKGQLWYNTSNNFNDPFDCKALINFGITEIERKTNFEKFNNAFNTFQNTEYQDMLLSSIEVDKLISNIAAKSIENSIGVTCFSENFDNTLMWAHYADKHKGLVLEFKKDKNGSLYRNMLPINYYESYPVINVSDYSEDQMNSVLYQIIGAKGNDWEYENEWRAINRQGGGLKKFDKSELTGIIFGLNTPENDKTTIFDLVQKSGYANINFKEAEFESGKFIVNYKTYLPQ